MLGEAAELGRTATDYDPIPGGNPIPEGCSGRSGQQGVRFLLGGTHTVGHRSAEGKCCVICFKYYAKLIRRAQNRRKYRIIQEGEGQGIKLASADIFGFLQMSSLAR